MHGNVWWFARCFNLTWVVQLNKYHQILERIKLKSYNLVLGKVLNYGHWPALHAVPWMPDRKHFPLQVFCVMHFSVMQLQYWALKFLFWTLSLGNGDCLGYRKPKQPYQWLTYKQVSIVHDRWINLGFCLVTLKWGNNYLAGFRQN